LRKSVFLFGFFILLTATKFSLAQNDEIRLVSPIGAAVRSAFLPGYGQIYADSNVRGGVLLVSFGALIAGGFVARDSYQDLYQDYKDAAWEALDRPQDQALQERKDILFDKSNQRFKLSQFLFFASLGVWAYGVIDSYVSGNVYNAQVKSEKLLDDVKGTEKMEFQLDVKREQINLTVTANF
jgi:hypothetical protein